MSDNLADDVFYRFLENITTLVSPLDEVSNIPRRFRIH